MSLSRRRLLAAGAAGVAAPAILHWPADAAEFTYKFGGSLPDGHPMAIRAREAIKLIKEESGGRLDITLYTNSLLGGDTAMISQAIAGALEMYVLPLDLLAAKNPACGIFGVGYAFLGYDHIWPAMDGALGDHLRGIAEQIGFHVVHNCYDHGFREITARAKPIETPADLKGFKIRLPVAPYYISLFQHLGAAPTPINFSEVYSALADGRGRRAGKPARADRHRQALRGPEILQPDQPHLGRAQRLLQQHRVAAAAARLAGIVGEALQRQGARRACRLAGDDPEGNRESEEQGHDVQFARSQALPGRAAQDGFLHADEEEVGRQGVGAAAEAMSAIWREPRGRCRRCRITPYERGDVDEMVAQKTASGRCRRRRRRSGHPALARQCRGVHL